MITSDRKVGEIYAYFFFLLFLKERRGFIIFREIFFRHVRWNGKETVNNS